METRGRRGRPRIRSAEYWRAYYTQKQREWRAVHLYGQSPDAVTRVLHQEDRNARLNGRVQRAVRRYARETKSRHAVKRDG